MSVNATGPLEQALRLKAKVELATKVGTLVDSNGWCTLPNGNTAHLSHDECVKRGGLWSPAGYLGGYGRGFGGGSSEESAAHEAGESAAQESAEGEGSAPSAPAAPSGGGGAPAGGGVGGGPAA